MLSISRQERRAALSFATPADLRYRLSYYRQRLEQPISTIERANLEAIIEDYEAVLEERDQDLARMLG